MLAPYSLLPTPYCAVSKRTEHLSTVADAGLFRDPNHISQYQILHTIFCPPKILHKHCFYFLLGHMMIAQETENNAYAIFWVDKQRILWCFLYWLIGSLTSSPFIS